MVYRTAWKFCDVKKIIIREAPPDFFWGGGGLWVGKKRSAFFTCRTPANYRVERTLLSVCDQLPKSYLCHRFKFTDAFPANCRIIATFFTWNCGDRFGGKRHVAFTRLVQLCTFGLIGCMAKSVSVTATIASITKGHERLGPWGVTLHILVAGKLGNSQVKIEVLKKRGTLTFWDCRVSIDSIDKSWP